MNEQVCVDNGVDIEPSTEDILRLLKGGFSERAKARQLMGFFDEQKMLSHR